jgi:transposase
MRKQHIVKLSEGERADLEELVKKGKHGARMIRRAHTLLLSDKGHTDEAIGELLHVTALTVARTREQWVKERRLVDKPRAKRRKRLDGKQEAFLVALTCSEAPEGRAEWSMQLLADKLLELSVIDQPVSDETVRRTLKKTSLSRG